ncbi:glycosyltransferase family 2 protein [Jeotgalibacillus proteolyticus]|uniref:Glycosyl transferase family 2 n=1 Tax=Jeotgalibacillus proteolyticus TaxID=2082395 RepID=A0A2S5GBK3_9BACL|nr:glycosyltransferase family 2 protein [Jeotgalibacillus proteolyticus]PPA70273.1 glycosyl transferase family 2 [Jeotgalibacillus proteolyticus]
MKFPADQNILIIVPAYNEEKSISSTLSQLSEIKEELPVIDVCVINDGSKDNTSKIVKQYPDVILIDLPLNLGIGGAVQTGYKYAHRHGYSIAIQFDADGQHSAEDLTKLIQPIMDGEADMVIGSRFVQKTSYKGSLARRIGIYYFYLILKALTKQSFTDPTSGYRAKNANVIKLFANHYPKDYPEPEVLIQLYKKGFKSKEVTVNMNDRQEGESSITPLKTIYYMGKVTLAIFMQKIVRSKTI